MSRNMRTISARTPQQVKAALFRAGESIMADSKKNYVPVDLDTLRSSGFVVPPVQRGTRITVQLAYGQAASAYALAVHEHPSIFDPPSWQGVNVQFTIGGPKYLEIPMMQAAPTLARELGADLALNKWARV